MEGIGAQHVGLFGGSQRRCKMVEGERVVAKWETFLITWGKRRPAAHL